MDTLLEIFPERVTESCEETQVEFQADMQVEGTERDENSDENDTDENDTVENDTYDVNELFAKLTLHDFQQEMCHRRYADYHYACIITHVFIDDREAQTGGGLLHAFLDECGNVVRQTREKRVRTLGNYRGAWLSGSWDERNSYENAEVGPAYLPGRACGPPYGERIPQWLQICTQDV